MITDPRILEQLNIMNVRLRSIQTTVNEMNINVKSIAEKLQVLANRGIIKT